MLYQLPDGRTVEISINDYLDLTDEELKELVGYPNVGEEIRSPLYGSAITKPGRPSPQDGDYRDKELPDVPDTEKFNDQDYTVDE